MSAPQEQHNYQEPAAAPPPETERNTVGLIALVVAVLGFIFACIPGALIVGWILLPIAFVLAIVGVALSGKTKGTAVVALIVSIVGTVVGFVVFFAVVAGAVDDAADEAFGSGEVSVSTSDSGDGSDSAEDSDGDSSEDQGTRAHPYPLGSTITDGDWDITVDSVDLDADEQISAENPYNDPPEDGKQYVLATVTATYTGDDPDGKSPGITLSYVTPEGNTVNSYDSKAIVPDSFENYVDLYEGASATGNFAFEAPSEVPEDGTLEVRATPFSDKIFVAVQ